MSQIASQMMLAFFIVLVLTCVAVAFVVFVRYTKTNRRYYIVGHQQDYVLSHDEVAGKADYGVFCKRNRLIYFKSPFTGLCTRHLVDGDVVVVALTGHAYRMCPMYGLVDVTRKLAHTDWLQLNPDLGELCVKYGGVLHPTERLHVRSPREMFILAGHSPHHRHWEV